MQLGQSVTYGRIPYWPHNGHTATVVDHTDLGDGTADVVMLCDCSKSWAVSVGVDDSEEPPEG